MRILTGPDQPPGEQVSDADLVRLYAAPQTPWLRVNMVSTVDGAVSGDDGRSGSINNAVDKRVFDTLRGLADVILVGAGTARAEGYRPADKPIVVVSRSGRLPESLADAEPGKVMVATCRSAEGVAGLRDRLGADNVLAAGSHRVDLGEVKAALADRGFGHMLAEGGPHLARDLIAQEAADELNLTVVPLAVGGTSGRITDGPPVAADLRLGLMLEESGTLLTRWFVQR